MLGIRRRPRHYAYALEHIDLGKGESVQCARWLHPKVRPVRECITQDIVDGYRTLVKPGDFCLDIGAQTGVHSTLPLALAVSGGGGCVLALEPNPYVYHVLEKNARANRPRLAIQTIMAAASDHDGFLTCEYSDAGFCNGGRHENIPMRRHGNAYKMQVFCLDLEHELLDNFREFLPRLTFIKVDTEGYDLHVLRGLTNIIEDVRPVVKAEVYKRTDRAYRRELLKFFLQRDYTVFRLNQEPVGCGPRLTQDRLEECQHYDVICKPNTHSPSRPLLGESAARPPSPRPRGG